MEQDSIDPALLDLLRIERRKHPHCTRKVKLIQNNGHTDLHLEDDRCSLCKLADMILEKEKRPSD